MTDIFAMCPESMKDRANNLAEAIVKYAGSGRSTFDLCPRVLDVQGTVWLWANLQRSESIADSNWGWIIPDLGRDVDLVDAQNLLNSSVVIKTEEDIESALIIDNIIISTEFNPSHLLTLLGCLSTAEE